MFTVPALYRDLEDILYVFTHLALKIVNEAVVEGMYSIMHLEFFGLIIRTARACEPHRPPRANRNETKVRNCTSESVQAAWHTWTLHGTLMSGFARLSCMLHASHKQART